jgi:hypothetical protein
VGLSCLAVHEQQYGCTADDATDDDCVTTVANVFLSDRPFERMENGPCLLFNNDGGEYFHRLARNLVKNSASLEL